MPLVSFLIPARNEEKNIEECICAIKTNAGKIPSYEIIVGDHGSTDETASKASSAGAIVKLFTGGTIASLRNRLVHSSSGEIIIFLDADVHVSASWGNEIENTLSSLSQDSTQITGSRCSPPISESFFIKNWFSVMKQAEYKYLGTGHIIFTRVAFNAIEGFNESLTTGEDYDFCARAAAIGYVMKINPKLMVTHHDYPTTLNAFINRERWHGLGDFQSWGNIFKSKVALATVFFLALHLVTLLVFFVSTKAALWGGISIFALMTCFSFLRFPMTLKAHTRACTILIFYFYFIGRTLSLISTLCAARHPS